VSSSVILQSSVISVDGFIVVLVLVVLLGSSSSSLLLLLFSFIPLLQRYDNGEEKQSVSIHHMNKRWRRRWRDRTNYDQPPPIVQLSTSHQSSPTTPCSISFNRMIRARRGFSDFTLTIRKWFFPRRMMRQNSKSVTSERIETATAESRSSESAISSLQRNNNNNNNNVP
jgi:hypothetical protein